MNELIERIKEKRQILAGLTIGLILFTIPLIFLVDDFVHNVILVPIAYYIWLGKIIIEALPQNYFLILLIILSILIITPSLRRGRRTIWRPKQPPVIFDGQVAIWEQRLRLLTSGSYTEQRFAYHLGHLVLQLLAYEERLPIRAVIYNLEKGAFDMPDQVRQYVLAGIGMGNLKKRLSLKQRFRQWWIQIFHQKQNKLTIKQYEEILPTIQYIESKLHISEDVTDVGSLAQESLNPEVNYDK